MEGLRTGLHESNYVEGQNLAIEIRFSPDLDVIRQLAADFVRARTSVILAFDDGRIPRRAVRDDADADRRGRR